MALTASSTLRNVRVEDELWDRAMSRAAEEGTTISALMRSWLEDYANAGAARADGKRRAGKIRLSAAERKLAVEAIGPEAIVAAVVDAVNAER